MVSDLPKAALGFLWKGFRVGVQISVMDLCGSSEKQKKMNAVPFAT